MTKIALLPDPHPEITPNPHDHIHKLIFLRAFLGGKLNQNPNNRALARLYDRVTQQLGEAQSRAERARL